MDMQSSAERPDALKARLEELKRAKGQLSREVARSLDNGQPGDGLTEDLKCISSEIKQLQKRLKKTLNETDRPEKWSPQTLVISPAIADRTVQHPVEVEDWNHDLSERVEAYVSAHPAASIWHRPTVTQFIESTHGHATRYLCAVASDGTVAGVLPAAQLKSRLFGNFLVSLPYFNYGGVLADSPEIARTLIAEADRWRQQCKARSLEMRFCQDNRLGYPQRTDKVAFWLSLPTREVDLWDSFQPKLRAQIRRGEREMSGFEIGGEDLLDDFYRVFAINMRDLGTPVYSKAFFRNLLRTLDGLSWLVIVRIEGRAVGCAFLTGYGDRMEIPWASTLKSQNHTGINMIMYWKVLAFAIEKGFKVFDFGRCSHDAGTYRFKQQWGAQPLPLYWDYLLPDGQSLPALNPDNPRFRLMIAVWQRLPVWLTRLIGPPIVKALP